MEEIQVSANPQQKSPMLRVSGSQLLFVAELRFGATILETPIQQESPDARSCVETPALGFSEKPQLPRPLALSNFQTMPSFFGCFQSNSREADLPSALHAPASVHMAMATDGGPLSEP